MLQGLDQNETQWGYENVVQENRNLDFWQVTHFPWSCHIFLISSTDNVIYQCGNHFKSIFKLNCCFYLCVGSRCCVSSLLVWLNSKIINKNRENIYHKFTCESICNYFKKNNVFIDIITRKSYAKLWNNSFSSLYDIMFIDLWYEI